MTGADPGGSWGADDPPFSLKIMASFRKIEPFSLAKLQLFQIFSSYCSIMHSNLTSKVPNLVEIVHKKQLTPSRSRQLGGAVNHFVGVSKNLRVWCFDPFPQILYPPLYDITFAPRGSEKIFLSVDTCRD